MAWNKGADHERAKANAEFEEAFVLAKEIAVFLDGKSNMLIFLALAILVVYLIQDSKKPPKQRDKMADDFIEYVKLIMEKKL